MKLSVNSFKKHALRCGFPLFCIGVSALIVGYFASWSNDNVFLSVCSIIIISGLIIHVISLKRQSRY